MASVNFSKCKAGTGDAGALMRHCDKEERLQHEHSNEHIDKTLTSTNEQTHSYRNAMERFRDRLNELDNTTNTNKRKDRVECFALESAVPDRMNPVEFANIMIREVSKQYGKENLVSVYLHKDEVHEYMDRGELKVSKVHVHMFVVPEHDGRLNGKWFSSRANMQKLNKAIDAQCKERGFVYMTGEHPRKRSVEELKLNSYQEAVKAAEHAINKQHELERQLSEAREELLDARERVVAYREENNELQVANKSLEVKLGRLEGEVQQLDFALMNAREAAANRQPKKRLFRQPTVEVPPEEWTAVKERAMLNEKLGTLQLRDDARNVKELADQYAEVQRNKADRYLEKAQDKGQLMIEDAQRKIDEIMEMTAKAQLNRIREDFPEVDRCFSQNGAYQGKNWPDKHRHSEKEVEIDLDFR